jgi:hypothetical protein
MIVSSVVFYLTVGCNLVGVIVEAKLLIANEKVPLGLYGYLAASSTLLGTVAALNGWWFLVPLVALNVVFLILLWWRDGGGNGTKRRLRSLKEKFKPVRRTAPATAGA